MCRPLTICCQKISPVRQPEETLHVPMAMPFGVDTDTVPQDTIPQDTPPTNTLHTTPQPLDTSPIPRTPRTPPRTPHIGHHRFSSANQHYSSLPTIPYSEPTCLASAYQHFAVPSNRVLFNIGRTTRSNRPGGKIANLGLRDPVPNS
jgi:hypothetical protein